MQDQSFRFLILSISLMIFGPLTAQEDFGPDLRDTRLLSQPDIHENLVTFVYDYDVWVADLDQPQAYRLTSHPGPEQRPRFSPDGKFIAFSGEYDGNTDVFIVPVTGGIPRRLTYHPSNDVVEGFTPNGEAVLFTSPRFVHTNRYTQLFTVGIEGGYPEQLKIPHGYRATYAPDGKRIAYLPTREAFEQWKHYRGGTNAHIWIFDNKSYEVEEIPQPEERCNDTDPQYIGEKIYFRSDRNGEFNLFVFDPDAGSVEQLTEYDDFPVINVSGDGEKLIFEQAGYLHIFNPESGEDQRLQIAVPADLQEARPRWVSGFRNIRNSSLSPSGARLALEFRGEIVTVPAEKGDPRNITQSTGANDRSPAWSPDGKKIAWLSDQSGEYQLMLADQDGRGEAKAIELDGAGFYSDLKWSPDGKKISYQDNARSIYILDVDSETCTKVDSDPLYGPVNVIHHAWSPDSRWLAYVRITKMNIGQVFVYDTENGQSTPISDGLSDALMPEFDASGKYLYFVASTDAGPVRTWFAQSNNDLAYSQNLYMVVLPSGEPSPLAAESDEEVSEDQEEEDEKSDQDNEEVEELKVEIDFEGISQRILSLPLPNAFYHQIQTGKEGNIFMITSSPFGPYWSPEQKLQRFSLKDKEAKTLMEGVNNFELSRDHQKIMVRSQDNVWIQAVSDKLDPGKGKLAIEDIKVRIDPRQEWRQIYEEVWRINRDYFYDPGMHGADWPAMKEKYAQFLPALATRSDLNRVMMWMCSELAVGHHSLGGGDQLYEGKDIPVGLLGADIKIEKDRYRLEKVYGGLNWNPGLRAPLTEPGVEAQAGEYIIAIDGKDLRASDNIFRHFEGKAGKIVELTLADNPNGKNSRQVRVEPISNERQLRNRDWVEGNLQKVTEATNGRVAYVHVPNTGGSGHEYFKRYFFPQADREAVIVDERYNGGGQIADYYIDILRRPYIASWATRYGESIATPLGSIPGPKVMLIDEGAGSGGDLLPWMFRKFDLGPIIGKRTWGGLVGILGFPSLIDGGYTTAPNIGFWTEEEGFGVENEGVAPDIEVEQWPKDLIEGRDPQLEKAIETVMKLLEENPPRKYQQPPFPNRVRP